MRLRVTALVALLSLAMLPTASASDAAPCQDDNMYVIDDVRDTLRGDPQCGSLSDPCFANGSRCYGCGPDVLEWIIGPIYC